jgi:hypothetical protein
MYLQIAGQSQSGNSTLACDTEQWCGVNLPPLAAFATTSTRPYLILFFPFVVSRAERTGGMMVPKVSFDLTLQDL